jgi:ribosomal protein L37AE/L43A
VEITTALLEEAKRYAANAQARLSKLEADLKDIERQKAEVEAKCQAARVATKRLLKFEVQIGSEYQCPRCWIEHERRSALRGVASRTSDDIMACRICGAEFVIPSR